MIFKYYSHGWNIELAHTSAYVKLMKQGFPIAALGLCGLIALATSAANADSAPSSFGARIVLAKAPTQPTPQTTRIGQSLAALPVHSFASESTANSTKTTRPSTDLPADDLVSTPLSYLHDDSPRKRNLEFSGRHGPKLRIGLKQEKVRFALNFKLLDDVFFAPAYRLAISKADFQNPEGYWAHSVFFAMRFHFNSDAK